MNEINVKPLMLNRKSKSSKFASWKADGNSIFDELLRALYLFVLIAIDFVIYIYSINGEIIENGVVNRAFLNILLGVFGGCCVLILLLSFSKVWQNTLCALITTLVTVAFFNQFMIRDLNLAFETFLLEKVSFLSFLSYIPAVWYIAVLVGVIIFFLFYSIYGTIFVTVIMLIAGAVGIKKNEFIEVSKEEYNTVKSLSKNVGLQKDKNLIYFMLPKFPSYQFLDSVNDDNFKELKNMMLGFYATNKFEVYSNVFVAKNDIMSNVAEIYNQVDYMNPKGIDRGYAEYINNWEFVKGGLAYASLEDNKLYDYLMKEGYGVSTYSMPGFDLCLTRDEMYTDRCVMKGYKRVELYNKKVSLENNVYALLAEWVDSFEFDIFKGLVKRLADKSYIKNMKVLSRNRRIAVEGSVKLFDKLVKDIKNDGVGQVYMVYADLPSINYVYDEYCNIKPREKWIALNDNTIYTGGISEKRKAYVDQMKCFIGRMQLFVDELKESQKLDSSNIVLQGISTVRELAEMRGGRYANFVADNLVGMAIRKSDNSKFLINPSFCFANDVVKNIIGKSGFCYSIDDLKIPDDEREKLKDNLLRNSYLKKHRMINIVSNYRDWYMGWKNKNKEKLSLAKDEKKVEIVEDKKVKENKVELNKNEQSIVEQDDNDFSYEVQEFELDELNEIEKDDKISETEKVNVEEVGINEPLNEIEEKIKDVEENVIKNEIKEIENKKVEASENVVKNDENVEILKDNNNEIKESVEIKEILGEKPKEVDKNDNLDNVDEVIEDIFE